MQIHHKKNVEARVKVVLRAEYLLEVLSNYLNVRRFLYILLKDVVGFMRD